MEGSLLSGTREVPVVCGGASLSWSGRKNTLCVCLKKETVCQARARARPTPPLFRPLACVSACGLAVHQRFTHGGVTPIYLCPQPRALAHRLVGPWECAWAFALRRRSSLSARSIGRSDSRFHRRTHTHLHSPWNLPQSTGGRPASSWAMGQVREGMWE